MTAQPFSFGEVESVYDVAYRAARRLVNDRETAEDLAQEAVARALVDWDKVRGHEVPWTRRVVANLVIQQWRKRRLPPEQLRWAPSFDLAAVDTLDLSMALRGLSRRQQEVVVLRYVADWSLEDVASSLGCSVGTVAQHSARGLAALRRALGPSYRLATNTGVSDVFPG